MYIYIYIYAYILSTMDSWDLKYLIYKMILSTNLKYDGQLGFGFVTDEDILIQKTRW